MQKYFECVFFIGLFVFGSSYFNKCYSAWGYYRINSDHVYSAKIRIDSSNTPHMIFRLDLGNIVYVKYLGGINISSTVIATGGPTDFDLDSNDKPHAIYGSGSTLQYVRWIGVSWSTPTAIDQMSNSLSMVVDKNDIPHIVYSSGGILKYAKWTGTAFSTQTIGTISGFYVSIDVDSNNHPHVSYDDNCLKYAKWTGSTWSLSTVESSSAYGENNSIVIDSSGYPHISYDDSTNDLLRYARWNGSSWIKESVGNMNYAGGYSCIALDSQNKPSISFNNGRCYYATRAGSNWSISSLGDYPGDSGGVVTSIAIDSNGNPYCAFGGYYLMEFAKKVNAPALSWTGEQNFISDGVNPDVGSGSSQYTFKVKYTNLDNNPTKTGYPKVTIQRSGYFSKTLILNYESGDYLNGAIYSTTTAINNVGNNINYFFEAYDIWNASAPVLSAQGPIVGRQPILSWTGEPNYTSGGMFPTTGNCSTQFTFKVKYTDADNDAPRANNPSLYISKVGGGYSRAITLNYESGDYLTGAVYSTATAISMVGNNFQYEFSAWDIWNSSASAFLFGSGPAITNHSPVLSWAGVAGFTTDGVNPDSAIAGTSFTFKVKYSDVDNDAPALGCPQLIVTKGYNTLKCLAMNYESGDNLTGAIYSTTTIIQTAGNNINYQFSAYDIAGSSANMFISGQGPTITNHEPVLSWVGGVDYYNDGVSPNTARAGTPFTFKIKYTDADNNAPMSNYPRLLIEKGSNYLKNITLNFESGDYLNGAIYSTTTVMIAAGSDIHYQFSAYDICGDSASFVSASGPVIDNYKPVLSWAGGTGFTTDGVNPDTARAGTPFTFKVKYTDADNDAPATYYPRVSIKKGSSYVHNTILNYESGDFINGAIYSTTTVIVAAGSDIKYEFSAYDIWNDSASLIANGPQIDNNKPVLSWTGEPGYTADAVQPDSGGAQTPYIFRVKYTDADNDPPEWGRINLSISKNGSFIYSSGLNYQSGDFLNGAIYSATTYINNAGGEMDYELIAYDYWGTSASISNIGPIINNTNPKLEWTGEQNYSSCGVFPVTGVVTTTFTFRVKYIDADNDAPNSWCPRIHIKKAGVDIYWGQMTTTDTNNYSQGRIYSYSKMLSTGTDYTYYFEGPDCWYNLATGTPTAPMQGPYVILGDNTPPSTVGFVYDGLNNSDIDSANSVTQLCACWGCSGDAESMITKYWYAIGTSAGGTEILGWTDNGMNLTVTVTDLNLTVGQKYFFSVRAENGIGLLGDPVSSNGQTVVLPGTYLDLSESKTYPNPSILNTAGNIAKSVMKFSHLPNGTDLGIYSISGKLVCKLNESASGGAGEIQWDGKNGNGDYIAQGIYLYILKTPDGQKKTGKIAVKRN